MSGLLILVEDCEDDVLLMQRAFKKAHINNEMIVFPNGRDAMLYIENPANTIPMIVFVDINLPDISGLDVVEYLHGLERLAKVCVFVFTVSDDQESVIRSWDAGATSFLRKPINIAKLLIAVQNCGVVLDIGATE